MEEILAFINFEICERRDYSASKAFEIVRDKIIAMNRFEYKTYSTAMELESILEHMGFKKRNFNSSSLVQYWEITKNEIVVSVNFFTESNRWETFIVLRGDQTMNEVTLSRRVKNIKGVLDLKAFISYL